MPVGAYFDGEGDKVMASMKLQYGPKKAKRVFYATANKRKKKKGAEAQAEHLKEKS